MPPGRVTKKLQQIKKDEDYHGLMIHFRDADVDESLEMCEMMKKENRLCSFIIRINDEEGT